MGTNSPTSLASNADWQGRAGESGRKEVDHAIDVALRMLLRSGNAGKSRSATATLGSHFGVGFEGEVDGRRNNKTSIYILLLSTQLLQQSISSTANISFYSKLVDSPIKPVSSSKPSS